MNVGFFGLLFLILLTLKLIGYITLSWSIIFFILFIPLSIFIFILIIPFFVISIVSIIAIIGAFISNVIKSAKK
jgi:hypothetical protein